MATLETANFGGQAAAFGTDGRTLFSGLPAVPWDMTDPADPRRLTPEVTEVTRSGGTENLSFNPVLPLLATAAQGSGPVQLWDISIRAQPALLDTLSGAKAEDQTLAFSPDGTLLAAPTDKGTVRLWQVAQHTRPTSAGEIATVRGKATALAFSPHSRTPLVGDDAGSITTWDVSDPGRPVRKGTSARHTGSIRGIAFHLDGALAATAGLDSLIRLWDVSDPARPVEATSLSGGGFYPTSTVVFSPDGRLLAVSSDRGMRLWTVDRASILQRLCTQSPHITRDQWAQYLPESPYDPPCA